MSIDKTLSIAAQPFMHGCDVYEKSALSNVYRPSIEKTLSIVAKPFMHGCDVYEKRASPIHAAPCRGEKDM